MQNAAEADDFDEPWMKDFVQKLSGFDSRMNEAVITSGILKHIPKGALGREGKTLIGARSNCQLSWRHC